MLIRNLICVTIAFGTTAALTACGDETGTGGAGGTSTTSSTTAGGGTENVGGAGGGTGSTGGAGGGTGGAGGGQSAAIEIETYTSSVDPPTDVGVNSHLIKGATEAVLVDGQFFTADGQAVVKMVKDSGKTLKTIFLTHAHPDHYAALETITKAFPTAEVVATKTVVADYNAKAAGTLMFLNGMGGLGPVVDDNTVVLKEVSGVLKVDGQDIKIVDVPNPGESEVAAVLTIAKPNAVFAGDLLYNNLHLVLSECGDKGWLDNIKFLEGQNFTDFYTGHGAKGTVDILAANTKYITDAIPILDAAADSAAAQTALKAKFPTYKGEFLLKFSSDGYFTNKCSMKP